MSQAYELEEIVVVNHGGWQTKRSRGIVKKISPTGRLTVELQASGFYNKHEIVFNPDGYERSSPGYNRSQLKKATQELLDEIDKAQIISNIHSIFTGNGSGNAAAHDLPLKILREMWELAKPVAQTA